MDPIKLSDAKCKSLSMDAPVEFLAAGESKGPDFVIQAYTGKTVDRWWGKLALSVDGIRAKKKMPILRDHDRGKIVGFSTEFSKDGVFTVSGNFSKKTSDAEAVRGLAEEGFPWQASIGVRPLKIVELKAGSDMMVNGRKLIGPAEVWMESEVSETSFVPLGADNNTSVAMLSDFDEVAQEANQNPREGEKPMEITLEMLKGKAPELLEQIKKTGADAERSRIQEVLEVAIPGHEKVIEKLAFDGVTTGPEAAMVILKAEKLARETLLKNHDADAPPALKQPAPSDTDKIPENLKGEERWKAEFEKSSKLQEEFGTADIYIGAMKADLARGNR